MPKPVLQSLILADHVYEDKLTGKRIIAGVFNRIIRGVRVIKEIPAPSPPSFSPPTFSLPSPQPAVPSQAAHAAPPPSAPVQPSEPSFVNPGQGVPDVPPSYQEPAADESPAPVQRAPISDAPQAPSPPPQAPPATPAQTTFTPPPVQPGQRVLEIPPTGLQSGSPFAYLSLTEVRGLTPFILQLVSLEDDTQLFRSDLRVECHNPLYTIELTVPLPPIAPPKAGIYALELLYNHEILGSLRIVVEDAAQ